MKNVPVHKIASNDVRHRAPSASGDPYHLSIVRNGATGFSLSASTGSLSIIVGWWCRGFCSQVHCPGQYWRLWWWWWNHGGNSNGLATVGRGLRFQLYSFRLSTCFTIAHRRSRIALGDEGKCVVFINTPSLELTTWEDHVSRGCQLCLEGFTAWGKVLFQFNTSWSAEMQTQRREVKNSSILPQGVESQKTRKIGVGDCWGSERTKN